MKDKTYDFIDNVLAGLLMAVTLGALAFSVATWIIPGGCYTRADPASSFWGCLIPGITILSSLFLAFILPISFFAIRRTGLPLPSLWYITALGAAFASQIAISAVSIIAAMPLHSGITYREVAFAPHGFVIGFFCGVLYWLMRINIKEIRQKYAAKK